MPQDDSTADYAVLFDMDGTLVNTEPYWQDAESALMAEYGLAWSNEQSDQMIGVALERGAQFLQEHGLPLEVEQIIGRLQEQVMARLAVRIPWSDPGARLLGECDAAGVATALVTMSRRTMAQYVIDAAPGRFAASITGDEVVRPKPDPHPYLWAAEQLGVPPHRCLAIEDSLTGARSAVDAGCVVYTTGPNAGQILGLPALTANLGLADLVSANFAPAG